jgi:hypothetical protein
MGSSRSSVNETSWNQEDSARKLKTAWTGESGRSVGFGAVSLHPIFTRALFALRTSLWRGVGRNCYQILQRNIVLDDGFIIRFFLMSLR